MSKIFRNFAADFKQHTTNKQNLTTMVNNLFNLTNNEMSATKPLVATKLGTNDNMTIGSSYPLPNVTFGKTYYIVLNGALRQVRFESVVFATKVDYYTTRCMYLLGSAAGLGRFAYGRDSDYAREIDGIKWNTWDGKIYACPEDYEERDNIEFSRFSISFERLFKSAFGNLFSFFCKNPQLKGVHSFNYDTYKEAAVRFRWTGTHAADADDTFVRKAQERLELFADGHALVGKERKSLADFSDYFNSTYRTANECKADNEVKVVCFEDEGKESETKTINVSITITADMLPQIVALGAKVVK